MIPVYLYMYTSQTLARTLNISTSDRRFENFQLLLHNEDFAHIQSVYTLLRYSEVKWEIDFIRKNTSV